MTVIIINGVCKLHVQLVDRIFSNSLNFTCHFVSSLAVKTLVRIFRNVLARMTYMCVDNREVLFFFEFFKRVPFE